MVATLLIWMLTTLALRTPIVHDGFIP
jgi:hypothetical protein